MKKKKKRKFFNFFVSKYLLMKIISLCALKSNGQLYIKISTIRQLFWNPHTNYPFGKDARIKNIRVKNA